MTCEVCGPRGDVPPASLVTTRAGAGEHGLRRGRARGTALDDAGPDVRATRTRRPDMRVKTHIKAGPIEIRELVIRVEVPPAKG